MFNSPEVQVLWPTWWRWRPGEGQGPPPRGGVWKKPGSTTAARWTRTGSRHVQSDERACDREVHIHQGLHRV